MVPLAVMSRGVHLLPLSSADEAVGSSSDIVDAGVEEGDRDDAVVGTSVFILGVMPLNGRDMPGNGKDMPGYGKDMPDSFPKEASCKKRMWAKFTSWKL